MKAKQYSIILVVFLIVLISASFGESTFAEEEPRLTASITSKGVSAIGYPLGNEVTLTVWGGECYDGDFYYQDSKETYHPWWSPETTLADFSVFDLEVGDCAEVTDGSTTKTINILNLTFDSMDYDTGIGFGYGPSSTTIQFAYKYSGIYLFIPLETTATGEWSINLSDHGITADDSMDLHVKYTFPDNNQLFSHAPNPRITVTTSSFDKNRWMIEALGWPLGVNLDLTLYAGECEIGPIYHQDNLTTYLSEREPNLTIAVFDGFDLDVGYCVKVTDGNATETMDILYFTFDSMDYDTGIGSGHGPANETIRLSASDTITIYDFSTQANPDGEWTFNFNEQGITVTEGMYINASYEFLNRNLLYAWAPTQYIHASLNGNWIVTYGWPAGANLSLTIRRNGPGGEVYFTDSRTATEGETEFGGFDLQAEDYIEITDGLMTETMDVFNITFDNLNYIDQILGGLGPPDEVLELWINDGDQWWKFDAPTSSEGVWAYDLTGEAIVVTDDMEKQIEYHYPDEDWLVAQAPNRRIFADADFDDVKPREWPLGIPLTLTLRRGGPAGEIYFTDTKVTQPDDYFFDLTSVRFYGFNLLAGDFIEITDGTYTDTLQVLKLTFDDMDFDTQIATGFGPPNENVEIWVEYSSDQWRKFDVEVNLDGTWSFDFSAVGLFVTEDMKSIIEYFFPNGDMISAAFIKPPQVEIGGPYLGAEGSAITPEISVSTENAGELSYIWDVYATPQCSFSDPSALNPNITCADNGLFRYSFYVSDETYIAAMTLTLEIENEGPSLGEISVSSDPVLTGSTMDVSVSFSDPGTDDTHTAMWDWGSGTTSQGVVSEFNGSGSVTGNHIYSEPGVYNLNLTIEDDDLGVSADNYQVIVTDKSQVIEADYSTDNVHLLNASADSTVSIEIYDGLSKESSVFGPYQWLTDQGGHIQIPLWQWGFDLMPGMLVEVTDPLAGVTSEVLVVEFTGAYDSYTNALSGTAPELHEINLEIQSGGIPTVYTSTVSLGDGSWEFLLDSVGIDDIQEWTGWIFDIDGDSTKPDKGNTPPHAEINSEISHDQISFISFVPGSDSTIHLFSEEDTITPIFSQNVQLGDWGEFQLTREMHGHDLVPGMVVSIEDFLFDGSTREISMTIATLAITDFDPENNSIQGLAEFGTEVLLSDSVSIGVPEEIPVIAQEDGTWNVAFDSGSEITGVTATILDIKGNRTSFYVNASDFLQLVDSSGTTLVASDEQNNETIIEIPEGAVDEPVSLAYIPRTSTTPPDGFSFIGQEFELNAYQDGSLLEDFVFLQPITITLEYDDEDVLYVDELSLTLNYWDETTTQWFDAAETCTPSSIYQRFPDDNYLMVAICHLSDFVLTGENYHVIFLPIINK